MLSTATPSKNKAARKSRLQYVAGGPGAAHRHCATEWEGWRLEAVDLDGNRIDRVLSSRLLVLEACGFASASVKRFAGASRAILPDR